MDAEYLVNKYDITTIEQNGRKGFKPRQGQPSAEEIQFIRDHKDEITAAIEARDAAHAEWHANLMQPRATTARQMEADMAYSRDVAPLEYAWKRAQRGGDSLVEEIEARDKFCAALDAWRAAYRDVDQVTDDAPTPEPTDDDEPDAAAEVEDARALESVMTPAEIEREFGLASGAVRQAIFQGALVEGSDYRRPDARTILVNRAAAVARWGGRKVTTSVFKASELRAGEKGWRVSLHTPGELYDEAGWWFRLKRDAQEFARRVQAGENAVEVYEEMNWEIRRRDQ